MIIATSLKGQTSTFYTNYNHMAYHSALSLSQHQSSSVTMDSLYSCGAHIDNVANEGYLLVHYGLKSQSIFGTHVVDTLPTSYHSGLKSKIAARTAFDYFIVMGQLVYNGLSTVWNKTTLPCTGNIVDIQFINSSDGLILTDIGEIYMTSNSGTTWGLLSNISSSNSFQCIAAISLNNIWIGENSGKLFHTSNGGGAWIAHTFGVGSTYKISMDHIDVLNGYVYLNDVLTTAPSLHKTIDGGSTFTQITNIPSVFYQRSLSTPIDFVDVNNGVVISATGDILVTGDAGNSWTQYNSPLGVNLDDSLTSVLLDSFGRCFLTTMTGKILKLENGLVWPGDANSDGVANIIDLLPVGIGFGSNGLIRSNASINWVGQAAVDFGNSFANGVNYKHADCDGNGLIDQNDLSAILLNYGLTHSKGEGQSSIHQTAPTLYVDVIQDTVGQSSIVTASIKLGELSNQADSIYGITFSLNFDPTLVDSGSVMVDYSNSWLGNISNSNDMISLDTSLYNQGRVDIGITRTNQFNNNGFGEVASIEIITIDDLSGKQVLFETLELEISNVKIISYEEVQISVNILNDSVVITDNPTVGIQKIDLETRVFVFPNPMNDQLVISSSNSEISKIRLTDALGKIVMIENGLSNKMFLETNGLDQGVYFVEIELNNGSIIQKKVIKK